MTPLNVHTYLRWPPWYSFISDDSPEHPHSTHMTCWISTFTSYDPHERPYLPQMTPLNVHIHLRWPPWISTGPSDDPPNVHIHPRWPPWMSIFISVDPPECPNSHQVHIYISWPLSMFYFTSHYRPTNTVYHPRVYSLWVYQTMNLSFLSLSPLSLSFLEFISPLSLSSWWVYPTMSLSNREFIIFEFIKIWVKMPQNNSVYCLSPTVTISTLVKIGQNNLLNWGVFNNFNRSSRWCPRHCIIKFHHSELNHDFWYIWPSDPSLTSI